MGLRNALPSASDDHLALTTTGLTVESSLSFRPMATAKARNLAVRNHAARRCAVGLAKADDRR